MVSDDGVVIDGVHNLAGKKGVDKRFFGDRNGDVEFSVDPSFTGAYGFRVTIDTLSKKCMLETKKMAEVYNPLKYQDVETLQSPISWTFANMIHEKVAAAIDTFKPGGRFTATIADGEWIIFRVTAGDELWMLSVHTPWSGETKRLTEIFTQMIADAIAGTLDEAKYMESLDNQ